MEVVQLSETSKIIYLPLTTINSCYNKGENLNNFSADLSILYTFICNVSSYSWLSPNSDFNSSVASGKQNWGIFDVITFSVILSGNWKVITGWGGSNLKK